jgi:hypothetical protein
VFVAFNLLHPSLIVTGKAGAYLISATNSVSVQGSVPYPVTNVRQDCMELSATNTPAYRARIRITTVKKFYGTGFREDGVVLKIGGDFVS